MRAIPQIAIDLVKAKETLVLFAYDDAHYPPREAKAGDKIDGTLTAGYGHTGLEVYIGMVVTQAKADAWLSHDLDEAAIKLLGVLPPDLINALTENQYSALLDFVLNLGTGDKKKPEWNIWKVLRAKHFDQVPLEMAKFVNARIKGVVVKEAGLVKRRNAEIELWSKDEPGSVDAPMPSSVTRSIETPPTAGDPVPAGQSKTILSGLVASVAAVPVAVQQVSASIAPYADKSEIVGHAIAILASIGATATVLGLVFAWLHKRNARN